MYKYGGTVQFLKVWSYHHSFIAVQPNTTIIHRLRDGNKIKHF